MDKQQEQAVEFIKFIKTLNNEQQIGVWQMLQGLRMLRESGIKKENSELIAAFVHHLLN